MPWLRSWYPPQSNHHHHRQAFVLGVTAVIFTACTFLSLFVSLPLAVIFILTSWTDSLRTSLTRWWAQWQEVSSSASGSTFGEVSQLFMQVIHHHHHCHHHMISVDIEVVFASGVLMMMYSNVLGFNWFLILLTYCAIDPNLTLLDSKRHRKPWVVRSVGGKSANGHLSSGPGRVAQQPRVFASIESSSKGGDRRMSTDESSRRWERPNILCKSWSSKSYLWQKLLLLEPAKRMTNISSRTVKHFGASFGIIFPTKNPVWHFT